jgi:hypothetical protein
MALTIFLNEDGTILTARFSGVIEYDEIEQAGLQRLEHPDAQRVRVWVTDFSDAELGSVSAEDVQRDIYLGERVAMVLPHLLVVAIMSDKFAYGMARMWQGLAGDTPPLPVHVVRTREEAESLVARLLGQRSDA